MASSAAATCAGFHLNSNNNARGQIFFDQTANVSNEQRQKRENLQKQLMRKSNIRLFSRGSAGSLAYWEIVKQNNVKARFPETTSKYSPKELDSATVQQQAADLKEAHRIQGDLEARSNTQVPEMNETEMARKLDFALRLGSNISSWHQEHKPIVSEYLLFLKDENLSLLKPQFAPIIRKCSRKTGCYILITNRILNRQVGSFKWIKYLIVQIQGPDYTMIKMCNTMLERWFPEYQKRVEYNKQRFKLGIYTKENMVDNTDLYFPYQRSGMCTTSFGSLRCDLPCGATGRVNLNPRSWRPNSTQARDSLLPSGTATKDALSHVYGYHPSGDKDRTQFREFFGEEELKPFKLTGDEAPPVANSLISLDHPLHPNSYNCQTADQDLDDEDDSSDQMEDRTAIRASKMVIKGKLKQYVDIGIIESIMAKRRTAIKKAVSDIPFPTWLLPTALSHLEEPLRIKDSGADTGGTAEEQLWQMGDIRYLNEDNMYIEYIGDEQCMMENFISPYPSIMQPGEEECDMTKPSIQIPPLRKDFDADLRQVRMQRLYDDLHSAKNLVSEHGSVDQRSKASKDPKRSKSHPR